LPSVVLRLKDIAVVAGVGACTAGNSAQEVTAAIAVVTCVARKDSTNAAVNV